MNDQVCICSRRSILNAFATRLDLPVNIAVFLVLVNRNRNMVFGPEAQRWDSKVIQHRQKKEGKKEIK